MANPKKPMVKKRPRAKTSEVDVVVRAVEAAERYERLRKEIGRLEEEQKAQKQIVLESMGELETSQLSNPHLKVVVVSPVRSDIDPVSLKANIGATLWNKVTRRVPDKQLLDSLIRDGQIDPVMVAKSVIETPIAPSIRVTLK